MLDKVFWGNSLEDWGISLAIAIGTMLVVKLLSLFLDKFIKPIIVKTKNKLDDLLYDALDAPVLFGLILIGFWVGIHRLQLPANLLQPVVDAYRILIVLNITWVAARLTSGALDLYFQKKADASKKTAKQTERMSPVVKRIIFTVIWLIGIVTALGNVGVNLSAILGTLGIGGIAFALAAQDTVKNVFGAFTLLTDRPFAIGDTVRIDSFEGTIVDIGVRSTKMRNYDKRLITFPNYKIADASIINISAEPMRRVVINLGLTYTTTPEKMKEAMTILREMPTRVQFVSPKDLAVHFAEFADSALVITFVYFIEKKGNIKEVTSNVNLEILTAFNQAKLDFAFPSQTLYLDKN